MSHQVTLDGLRAVADAYRYCEGCRYFAPHSDTDGAYTCLYCAVLAGEIDAEVPL